MVKHVVRPGECLTTIARQHGFNNYRTIYDHPDNAELRQKRPNPNILHPGDIVVIPPRKPKVAGISSGQLHRFRVVVPEKEMHLRLLDHEGNPIANEPYILTVDDEAPIDTKQTDGNGRIKERVPLTRTGATLEIKGRTLRLRFGQLNPLREGPQGDVSGLQGRLRNLGYNPGDTDGVLGPRTRVALAVFQADEGLDLTGDPDEQTLSKLEERHGC